MQLYLHFVTHKTFKSWVVEDPKNTIFLLFSMCCQTDVSCTKLDVENSNIIQILKIECLYMI